MSEVKWIQIATGIFDNRKIKQIERMPEGDAIIVVWMKLLCLAGTSNKNGLIYLTEEIPYTEETLAVEFGMEQQQRFNVLKLALRTFVNFNMIDIIDNVYYISSWDKYQNTEALNKIREQTRKRVAKHRESKKLLSNVTVTENVTHDVTQCNATDKDKEIDKDILNNTVQPDCTAKASKAEIEAFFERVWNLYPNKRGKGQVSDTQKRKLYNIGFDKISIAIQRYQTELEMDKWRQKQNGSTFFNNGYLDYLDGNYQPENKVLDSAKPQQQKTGNRFNNFPQRSYSAQDFEEIERKLRNRQIDGG